MYTPDQLQPGHSYPGANVEMGEIPDGAIPVGGMSNFAGVGEPNKRSPDVGFLMGAWSGGPGEACIPAGPDKKGCLGMASPGMPGLVKASFKGIAVQLKRAALRFQKRLGVS